MISPTVILGFNDARGSWKIIWICLRVARRLTSCIRVKS
ncbi:Uncharacterised protein [Vibrio cholerae]|nr:Uncharacterised protein [Vibrio cholerae]CSI37298.1 Uncharacterised protein [Vibrio cholerae]CSI65290.1 Uncharacterised protein [Vibrio cholerae]